MKKYLFSLVTIFLLLSLNAFAAGGGGGGGGGGGSVTPPAPVETQETAAPSTPAPEPTTCSEDTWTCTEWNACQMNGKQGRTCTLTKDCSFANDPKPADVQICTGLKCAQLPTLKERVQCRLGLTDVELKAEFDILYFPEYCKVEETEEDQQECIGLYRAFGPCWAMPVGPDRMKCGMKVSGIKKSPERDELQCRSKKTDAKEACLENVKENHENYILFQMYEYEKKAEDLLSQGKKTLQEVTDFDVLVEKIKQKVEKSEDKKVWKKLLKKIQKKFRDNFSEIPAI